MKLTYISLSVPQLPTNQTRNDSTSEDKNDDIHEAVGNYDPDYPNIFIPMMKSMQSCPGLNL